MPGKQRQGDALQSPAPTLSLGKKWVVAMLPSRHNCIQNMISADCIMLRAVCQMTAALQDVQRKLMIPLADWLHHHLLLAVPYVKHFTHQI